MKTTLVALAAALMLASLAACGDTNVLPQPLPTPGPDRIVGFEVKCTLYVVPPREFTGTACNALRNAADTSANAAEVHQVLTIRTPQGTVYTVVVPYDFADVTLGAPWPPP